MVGTGTRISTSVLPVLLVAAFLLAESGCERDRDKLWTPDLKRHADLAGRPKKASAVASKHKRGVESADAGEKRGEEQKSGTAASESMVSYRKEVMRIVKALGDAWGDGGEDGRAAAMKLLDNMDRVRGVPWLTSLLTGAPEYAVGAARALGLLREPSAVLGLVDGLRGDNAAVAEACAWAIGEIKAEQAVPVMTRMLAEGQRPPAVQVAILRALGTIGQSAVMPVLLKSAEDENPAVRCGALEAIGMLVDSAAGGHGAPEPEVVDVVIHAIDDRDRDVRMAAASVLVRLRSTRALPPMVRLLESTSESIRQMASKALVDFPDHGAVRPVLIDALEKGDGAARLYVMEALTKVCDASCIGVLEERAKRTPNEYARNAMQVVIRNVKGK